MSKLLAALVAIALTCVLAATAMAATRTVKVGDNWFLKPGQPRTISVKKNTTVRFKWVGDTFHNVTVTSGPRKFRSKTVRDGTFKRKLRKKGTYKLLCTVHGPEQSLTIRVR